MWGIDERYNLVVEDASEESTEEEEKQEEGNIEVDPKLLEKQKANQVIFPDHLLVMSIHE